MHNLWLAMSPRVKFEGNCFNIWLVTHFPLSNLVLCSTSKVHFVHLQSKTFFPSLYVCPGVPAVIVIFWSSLMSITLDSSCWNGYSKSPYIWILTIPMFCALIVSKLQPFFLLYFQLTNYHHSNHTDVEGMRITLTGMKRE